MRISDWSSDVCSSDLFLNLDRIIEIIRTEDEPKPVMLADFDLTDRQAEAILNMRLRSLRKLEEMDLRREHDALETERGDLEHWLGSATRPRTRPTRALTKIRALRAPAPPPANPPTLTYHAATPPPPPPA